MISNLPRDLVEEILLRVPATSLKQLRTTCKLWNNIFNNKRFTNNHFDKAPKQVQTLMWKDKRVFSTPKTLKPLEFTSELTLIDPLSSLEPLDILKVSHCDGLLLCTTVKDARFVVWNPCTGQTRWINPVNKVRPTYYAIGSYKDNKHHGNSYKLLSYEKYNCDSISKLAIYDFNFNSWKILDVKSILDCELISRGVGVSFKGTSYWFGFDRKDQHSGLFLVSFDFTTERFGRLPLPFYCSFDETVSLSVVREEELSVFVQPKDRSNAQIWMTNKIGETKVVSWNMVLAVDLIPKRYVWRVNFLVDEEKKVVVFRDYYIDDDDDAELRIRTLVHIVGEDNKVRLVEVEAKFLPFFFTYVPSLIQI